MSFKTIAIVGLGLMGGSLAAACRKKFPKSRILGISRDRKALAYALKKHWIHEGFQGVDEAMKKGTGYFLLGTGPLRLDLSLIKNNLSPFSGLVILCTPVDTLQSLLTKIDKAAPAGILVTDVGSVKGEIVRWAGRRRFRHIQFIGAHPMAGSHERGISVARPNLYDNSFTFVTRPVKGAGRFSGPVRKTYLPPLRALTRVINFWRKISPRVVVMSAEEHDQIMGEISHLPHLAAICLALTPQKKSLRHSGPGFADATRIAQGHPSIWSPIFCANRRAVLKALGQFEKNLRHFRKALGKGGRHLGKILTAAAKRRRQISL